MPSPLRPILEKVYMERILGAEEVVYISRGEWMSGWSWVCFSAARGESNLPAEDTYMQGRAT